MSSEIVPAFFPIMNIGISSASPGYSALHCLRLKAFLNDKVGVTESLPGVSSAHRHDISIVSPPSDDN